MRECRYWNLYDAYRGLDLPFSTSSTNPCIRAASGDAPKQVIAELSSEVGLTRTPAAGPTWAMVYSFSVGACMSAPPNRGRGIYYRAISVVKGPERQSASTYAKVSCQKSDRDDDNISSLRKHIRGLPKPRLLTHHDRPTIFLHTHTVAAASARPYNYSSDYTYCR